MVVVNITPVRSLRSAKEFKIKGLEALGVKSLGDPLPLGLTKEALERAQHFLKTAEDEYWNLRESINSPADRNTADDQYHRCTEMLNRVRRYNDIPLKL